MLSLIQIHCSYVLHQNWLILTPNSDEEFSSFSTSVAFKSPLRPSTIVYTTSIRMSINTNTAMPSASFKSFKFWVILYDKCMQGKIIIKEHMYMTLYKIYKLAQATKLDLPLSFLKLMLMSSKIA